jgi:hypothetical protein
VALTNVWCVIALVAIGAPSLRAQDDTAARRDPADARAVVPQVIHMSIPLVRADTSDDMRIPWKEANDEVGCIGGWRVYARESRESPSAASPAHAPQSKTPPKACSDHRDPRVLERESGNRAR